MNRSTMEIQYVYDADGRRTGVIVPIESLGADVGSLEPRRRCRFDEVYGVYRDLIRDPDVIASGLRDEWERG